MIQNDIEKPVNSHSDASCCVQKGEAIYELPDTCVVVDIETTGFNPNKDNIIEISALKVINNKIEGEFSMLVNPNRDIPYFITRLTGITNDMIKEAKPVKEVLLEFNKFIGNFPIVGHNIKFDLSFLNSNMIKYYNKPLSNNFSDTLYFARRIYKELPSRKLTKIAEHLNINTDNAHRALADCYMTYKIMLKMKQTMEGQ